VADVPGSDDHTEFMSETGREMPLRRFRAAWMKATDAPAVKREAEEEWGKE
jgi:hypothetical protein